MHTTECKSKQHMFTFVHGCCAFVLPVEIFDVRAACCCTSSVVGFINSACEALFVSDLRRIAERPLSPHFPLLDGVLRAAEPSTWPNSDARLLQIAISQCITISRGKTKTGQFVKAETEPQLVHQIPHNKAKPVSFEQ